MKALYYQSLSSTLIPIKKLLIFQEGFEPPTVRLEGECSIQLSYWNNRLINIITHQTIFIY